MFPSQPQSTLNNSHSRHSPFSKCASCSSHLQAFAGAFGSARGARPFHHFLTKALPSLWELSSDVTSSRKSSQSLLLGPYSSLSYLASALCPPLAVSVRIWLLATEFVDRKMPLSLSSPRSRCWHKDLSESMLGELTPGVGEWGNETWREIT